MDLRDVLHAARRGWWLVLGCVLLGLLLAVALARSATPTYESTARLFVAPTDHADIDASQQGDLYAQERSESYARAVRSGELVGRVADELDLGLSVSEVAGKITASVTPKTVVVEITVTDSSARRAQSIAAALAEEFTRWVAAAETAPGSAGPRVQVLPIEAAALPSAPVSPDAGLLLGLGGSLGFLLGLAATVWGRRPWNAVCSEEDVRGLAGAPLIGALPDRPGSDAGPLPVAEHPPTAQRIRAVRRTLGLLGDGSPPRVVVVTGAVPGARASTLARDLAEELVRAGRRVALVEVDLRRAGGPLAGGPRGRTGFADILAGTATLADVVEAEGDGRLTVVPPGRWAEDPARLLRSPRARGLLDALRASCDHVIVDAPPVLSFPDAAELGALSDGCLLAVRYRRTRRAELADAAEALSAAGVPLLAVVLTGLPPGTAAPMGPGSRYRADADRGNAGAELRAVETSHV